MKCDNLGIACYFMGNSDVNRLAGARMALQCRYNCANLLIKDLLDNGISLLNFDMWNSEWCPG